MLPGLLHNSNSWVIEMFSSVIIVWRWLTLPHPPTLSTACTAASCGLSRCQNLHFLCEMSEEGARLVICMVMVNILNKTFVEICQQLHNCSFILSNLFIVHKSSQQRKVLPMPLLPHPLPQSEDCQNLPLQSLCVGCVGGNLKNANVTNIKSELHCQE